MRGTCWRRDSCSYLHENKLEMAGNENEHEINNQDETVKDMEVESSNIANIHHVKEIDEECGNCKSDKVKNECDQCRKYFCKSCEYKVNGEESESVMDFFKSKSFLNYTCRTAHY